MATYRVTSRGRFVPVGDDGWSVHWVVKDASALLCNPEGNSVGNLQNERVLNRGWGYGLQLAPTEAVFGHGFATWQDAALAAIARSVADGRAYQPGEDG